MAFSNKQVHTLRRNLNALYVRTRELNGKELSYVEAWHAIAEANRIFGFDGWDRETVEARCIIGRELRGTYYAVYIAKVRITVHADGHKVVREGHGSGEGRGNSPGETHDIALKAAETDATKRALATFGKPFGLALYLNGHKTPNDRNPSNGHMAPVPISGRGHLNDIPQTSLRIPGSPADVARRLSEREVRPAPSAPAETPEESPIDPASNDEPIEIAHHEPARETAEPLTARPAHALMAFAETKHDEVSAFGRNALDQHVNHPKNSVFSDRISIATRSPTSSMVAPNIPSSLTAANGELDRTSLENTSEHAAKVAARSVFAARVQSQFAVPRPTRLRNKPHLKFVGSRPCLVCGRFPSDAHHLRFAQPRALGLKVSDEFTVPLCRTHHRQLHQVAHEPNWWKTNKIDPLPVARLLWERTKAGGR